MTLYEKVGRKYKAVHDTAAIDGLGNGSWLVTVQDGLTKVRRPVDDEAGLKLLAANARFVSEWMTKALMESSAWKEGRGEKLSVLEQKAWKAYKAVAGQDCMVWMTKPSAADIADAVCKKIVEHIKAKL